jgi:hypothetical protein
MARLNTPCSVSQEKDYRHCLRHARDDTMASRALRGQSNGELGVYKV